MQQIMLGATVSGTSNINEQACANGLPGLRTLPPSPCEIDAHAYAFTTG